MPNCLSNVVFLSVPAIGYFRKKSFEFANRKLRFQSVQSLMVNKKENTNILRLFQIKIEYLSDDEEMTKPDNSTAHSIHLKDVIFQNYHYDLPSNKLLYWFQKITEIKNERCPQCSAIKLTNSDVEIQLVIVVQFVRHKWSTAWPLEIMKFHTLYDNVYIIFHLQDWMSSQNVSTFKNTVSNNI